MDKLLKEMSEFEKKNFIIVESSHGTVIANKQTGVVLSVELDPEEDESSFLMDIERFDLVEWQTFWCRTDIPETFDILDLAYRTKDNEYEMAEEDWRLRCFCEPEDAIAFCFKKLNPQQVFKRMTKAYLDIEDHDMVVALENEFQRYLHANYK